MSGRFFLTFIDYHLDTLVYLRLFFEVIISDNNLKDFHLDIDADVNSCYNFWQEVYADIFILLVVHSIAVANSKAYMRISISLMHSKGVC